MGDGRAGTYIQTEGRRTTLLPHNASLPPSTLLRDCAAPFSFHYDIPILVVSILCFIVALVFCFFGYRLFKATLFLTGLIFGSVLIYLVCDKESLLPPLGNAGVGLGAGILFGLITMLVEYVGVFMTGFLSGVSFGTVIMLVLSLTYPPSNAWVTIGVLFGCGLLLALLTLKWQRALMMMGTGLMGGAMVVCSVDYLVERFGLVLWVWKHLNATHPPLEELCWFSWLILSLLPSLFLVGFLVQWRITSVGYVHEKGFRAVGRKRRGSCAQPLTSPPKERAGGSRGARGERGEVESRGRHGHPVVRTTAIIATQEPHSKSSSATPNEPKSFRHLYQIRRAQGDVICQV